MGEIPPLQGGETSGWISSDQLPKLSDHRLAPSEVNAFLHYVFSDVARRTRQIGLRQGAAVARYLIALAHGSPPGPARQFLQELGYLIWWTLLQFSPIQPIRKETAIRFLEEFASAYLVGLDLEAALKQVRDTPPPTFGNLFEAPHLISRHRAGGPRNPHLQDDLSERIYAAYHALRRAGIHKARWRVAEALNAHGIGTRARKDTPRTWGSYEVYERVKQYEAGLKKRTEAVERVQTAQQCRASVVDQWTSAFRWSGICESLALRLHSPIA